MSTPTAEELLHEAELEAARLIAPRRDTISVEDVLQVLSQRLATALAEVAAVTKQRDDYYAAVRSLEVWLAKAEARLEMLVANPRRHEIEGVRVDGQDQVLERYHLQQREGEVDRRSIEQTQENASLRQRAEAEEKLRLRAEQERNDALAEADRLRAQLAEAQQREAWWREWCDLAVREAQELPYPLAAEKVGRGLELRRLLGIDEEKP